MPSTQSPEEMIRSFDLSDHHHVLVMIDQQTKRSGYCLYTPGSFGLTIPSTIHQLFDLSLNMLVTSSEVYLTKDYVPLLEAVGPWQITVVERDEQGVITSRDGLREPVDNHIALGS